MTKPLNPSTEDMSERRSGPPSKGRPALLVVFPATRALPVPPSNTKIGRSWFESHGVSDPKVSREHLVFTRRGALQIADLGSRNGTWVNGTRLSPNEKVSIEDGSIIRAGRTIAVYRDEYGGPDEGDAPLGDLAGPFGLWRVRAELRAIVKRAPANVLIKGETGTGKELVARWLGGALRPGKSYFAINVAAIAPGVFESQLFGHEKGAFSGALTAGRGVFAAHDGGIVFLDELGELPLEAQPKLLRLLDNREIVPVGGTTARRVDVVVVAATNRPLEEMVEKGTFRRDLHARFSSATIELPPLRDRPEDVLAIAMASVKGITEVEPEAVETLMRGVWRGNVRELVGLGDRTVTAAGGRLLQSDVSELVGEPLQATLTEDLVRNALQGRSEAEAARVLRISRGRLRRFLTRIQRPGHR